MQPVAKIAQEYSTFEKEEKKQMARRDNSYSKPMKKGPENIFDLVN